MTCMRTYLKKQASHLLCLLLTAGIRRDPAAAVCTVDEPRLLAALSALGGVVSSLAFSV